MILARKDRQDQKEKKAILARKDRQAQWEKKAMPPTPRALMH